MERVKNILFSVVAIAGVSALVVGVTSAVWTDNDTNEGNVFAAGDVNVELSNGEDTTTPFFNVEGMVPGEEEVAFVQISNNGTTDITFDLDLVNANPTGTPALDRVLEFQVTQVQDSNDLPAGYDLRGYNLWAPSPSSTDPWINFSEGQTLRDWRVGSLTGNPMSSSIAMEPDFAAVYKVEVRIANDADNDYQGNEFEVDLLATASNTTQ